LLPNVQPTSAERKCGPMSEETKAKIAAANRGKKRTDEVRAKISAVQTGKERGPHSEQTKEKMRAAYVSFAMG
jgi:hypothetical protein